MRPSSTSLLAAAVLGLTLAGCGLRDGGGGPVAGGAPVRDPAPSVAPSTLPPATPAAGTPTPGVPTPTPPVPATAAPAAALPATPAPVVLPDLGELERLLGEIDAQLAEDAAAPAAEGSTR